MKRRRFDALTEEKIARRVAEDRDQMRQCRGCSGDPLSFLPIGKWYWVWVGWWWPGDEVPRDAERLAPTPADGEQLPRYRPAKLLEARDGMAVVGYAEVGRVELVPPGSILRPLSPTELSDHLSREPLTREWLLPGGAQ